MLPEVDIVADITRGLPFLDDSVDEIVSCGTIEHFSHDELIRLSNEFHRILTSGGKLIIGVPDLQALMNAYLMGEIEFKILNQYLYGSQKNPLDQHKLALDFENLHVILQRAGFSNIRKTPYTFPFHISRYMMQVECMKETVPETPSVSMTSPQDNREHNMMFTGERLVPDDLTLNDLYVKHQARYAFAGRYIQGVKVLDAGCGCGYGSYALSLAGADFVVGIDNSSAAAAYSRRHYDRDRLAFGVSDCLQMPFADNTFDRVVSFEVLEHIADYRTFLAECRRVLKPGGLFFVSTPNKLVWGGAENPFHFKEFYLKEFREALSEYFRVTDILGQHIAPKQMLIEQNLQNMFTFFSTLINYYDASFSYTERQLDQITDQVQKYLDDLKLRGHENVMKLQKEKQHHLYQFKDTLVHQLDLLRSSLAQHFEILSKSVQAQAIEIPAKSVWFFLDVFFPECFRKYFPKMIREKVRARIDHRIESIKAMRRKMTASGRQDAGETRAQKAPQVSLAPLGKLQFETEKLSAPSAGTVRYPKNLDRKKLNRPDLLKIPLMLSDIMIRKEFLDTAQYFIAVCTKK
jgi:ubiquinone/menaquinone biosynthesis C-methylase UbiE